MIKYALYALSFLPILKKHVRKQLNYHSGVHPALHGLFHHFTANNDITEFLKGHRAAIIMEPIQLWANSILATELELQLKL